VALTSDYRFRGISQTDREPAIQGGFDWAHKSGFYLGTWGSNVDFGPGATIGSDEVGPSNPASLELDAYLGFSNNFLAGDKGSYDVGAIGYFYPGANKVNDTNQRYYEFYAKFGYDFGVLSGTVGVNYSPDYYLESGHFWYPAVDVDVPLPRDFGIAAHYGYNSIDKKDDFGTGTNYSDWKVGLTKSWLGLDWSLDYIDTDLSKSECFGGAKTCDATAVVTIAKSF
jgi:uncharacterized protein (TIGR02001 family)